MRFLPEFLQVLSFKLKPLSLHNRFLKSFTYVYPIVPASFIEKSMLYLLKFLGSFAKNHFVDCQCNSICTHFYSLYLYVQAYSSTQSCLMLHVCKNIKIKGMTYPILFFSHNIVLLTGSFEIPYKFENRHLHY